MKKLTVLFLAVLFLLSGCAKKEAEKNPYRLKTYTAESSIAGIPQSSIRCDYFYDENGQVCRWDSYWKGELHRSECPEYDEYGNIIRSTITNSDGTQTVEEHLLTEHLPGPPTSLTATQGPGEENGGGALGVCPLISGRLLYPF